MWGSKLKSLALAISLLSPPAIAGLTPGTEKCKGYSAANVQKTDSGLSADLTLIGSGCAIYGEDLKQLKLEVNYDTEKRLHVKIIDPNNQRYEVPNFTLPRPEESHVKADHADIQFELQEQPFAFAVSRKSTGEKLFQTDGAFIYEDQYIRIATKLAKNPAVYGLGEHTSSFKLPTTNYIRTLWNRDAYGVPDNSNLYSAHPIYFEHRETGTHGVFLVNSNGMDIKIDNEVLEYNIIGGILDFYFFAGPTPANVASQYAEVVGLPALPAFWGLGSHQCRYGYRDWIDVAEVIANYSAAAIPLETMWTDIDYMYNRWVFTLDPERFPLDKMRQIVDNLHKNDQKYIMMIDPAVAYQPYPSFQRGVEKGIFLKEANGDIHKGVVWPGVTAFPDWFHPNTTEYWTDEFARFFNAENGVDIDGSWIDMNEPANFCSYPCTDPEAEAIAQHMPPARLPVREPSGPIPGFPETETQQKSVKARSDIVQARSPVKARSSLKARSFGAAVKMFRALPKISKRAAPKRNLINPPYAIKNDVPNGLSDRTVHTDIVHADGHIEYDVHNLYGTSMSTATYNAMLSRRPGKRPFIITRSTFAGAGHKVGKWLGDNLSTWHHYRNSISGVLQFNSIYQIPLVGADVCGFGGNTTETLCARWTALGAFAPFYRNHNGDTSISQEPYRWPLAASAARKSISIRYSLLDYLYTALWRQSTTGVPSLSPLWFHYPQDKQLWGMDLQYFYGPSIVVAPVTAENSTSVDIYLPQDIWYDFHTHQPVKPGNQTLTNVAFDEIPLFIRGGSILPIRKSAGAMTTTEVRKRDFELLIVPDAKGEAKGELYIDDGESLVPGEVTHVEFEYGKGKLKAKGKYGFRSGVKVAGIKVLGGKKMVRQKEVVVALEKDFVVDC